MFCENCGAEIPDGSRFCGECGAPVGGDSTKKKFKDYFSQQPENANKNINTAGLGGVYAQPDPAAMGIKRQVQFVSPDETEVASIGSNDIDSKVNSAVLTQKRLYFFGNQIYNESGKKTYAYTEQVIPVDEITGTQITHHDPTWMKILAVVMFIGVFVGFLFLADIMRFIFRISYSLHISYGFCRVLIILLGIFLGYCVYKKIRKSYERSIFSTLLVYFSGGLCHLRQTAILWIASATSRKRSI